MRINFLNGLITDDLRIKFPNSMFLEAIFDEFIIGYHENGSIIYNLYGVISKQIELEFPEIDSEIEEDEWCEAYDEINDRLCHSDSLYSLYALEGYLDGNTGYYNPDFTPNTLCDDESIINYDGNANFIEVDVE